MQDTAVFRPKGTGKFPEVFLRVRGDPNDEIDHKRNMFPTIRFFALIPQILNLNVRFLIKLDFRIFEIFAIMHETALFRPKNKGKFPEFILTVRGDPNDEIDHKRKICSTIRFFDMISQILYQSLFAIYKLIKNLLPSKRHGQIS